MDAILKMVAEQNRRGVPTNHLVYELQDLQYKLETFDIEFQKPSDFTETEWTDDHKKFWELSIENILKEIDRRRYINEAYVKNPAREIIQAIKEDMPIADVIEWYTDVFYNSRAEWKFRCTLHGTDKDPSGVIYSNEQRWWCFACNRGGDVFDAVQAFERIELHQAIKKLATYLGIDLKPLRKIPLPKIRGGIEYTRDN